MSWIYWILTYNCLLWWALALFLFFAGCATIPQTVEPRAVYAKPCVFLDWRWQCRYYP